MQTLPWYYLNRLKRMEYTADDKYREVRYSEGVVTHLGEKGYSIKQDNRIMLLDNDIFMPALWMKIPAIITYSINGYQQKEWIFPDEWKKYDSVDIYQISLDGIKLFKKNKNTKGNIKLSLEKNQALLIIPSGYSY